MKIPGNIRLNHSYWHQIYYENNIWYEDVCRTGSRPHVCSTIQIIQLFMIKTWMRMPSNNASCYFLLIRSDNDNLFRVCKLTQIPDRKTIDRQFQFLSIGTIINTIRCRFILDGLVENSLASVDSSMLKAVGPV